MLSKIFHVNWLESISNFFPREFHNIRVGRNSGRRSEETESFSFASRDILITGNKDDQPIKIKRAWAVRDSSLTKIDYARTHNRSMAASQFNGIRR